MKIGDFNRGIQRPMKTEKASGRKIQTSEPTIFREVIGNMNREGDMEALTKMSQDVMKQGELLAERYDITELKRYKRMLSEFLSEVVRYSYEFNKRSTRDIRGKHHVYAIVKRINEKLEKIAQNILSTQIEQVQLIADINDINGMLVDLLA